MNKAAALYPAELTIIDRLDSNQRPSAKNTIPHSPIQFNPPRTRAAYQRRSRQ